MGCPGIVDGSRHIPRMRSPTSMRGPLSAAKRDSMHGEIGQTKFCRRTSSLAAPVIATLQQTG